MSSDTSSSSDSETAVIGGRTDVACNFSVTIYTCSGFPTQLHPEIFKVQAGAFKIQSGEIETNLKKLEVFGSSKRL